jgi:hypothetical protein
LTTPGPIWELLGVGLLLLANLRAETDRPVLWLWMVIAGIGIGPSFAVFTLVVQNAVAPDRIGVATSSLTFFQQIGGTVGLTVAGTIFVDRLSSEIPVQLAASGVPAQLISSWMASGRVPSLTDNRMGVSSPRMPLTQGWILRPLTNDRILHDRIAEMVNDGCDGECAPESFVQT